MKIKSAETLIFVIVALASATIEAGTLLISRFQRLLQKKKKTDKNKKMKNSLLKMSGLEELPLLNDTSAIDIS